MDGVRKMVRSGSLIVEELFGNKAAKRTETEPAEIEYESGFSGHEVPSTGLVLLEELVREISCSDCGQVIQGSILQCRKGHLYCRPCRRENKCRVCQQTFLESPSLGLDRLLSLVSLPCKHGERGCPETVAVPGKAEHETNCPYRPVSCQFQQHGCSQVSSLRDMFWHHKMCLYAHHPHANVLPNMPGSAKSPPKPAAPLLNGKA